MACTSRCKNAKGDECKCACGGANHGTRVADNDPMLDFVLTDEEANAYRNQMDRRRECFCGYEKLHDRPIYAGIKGHSGGWDIRGDNYWLWIHCPKCGYEWSVWKLGVPRDLIQKQVGDFVV